MIEAKQTVKLAICLMLAIGMSVGIFNVVGTDGGASSSCSDRYNRTNDLTHRRYERHR